MVHIDGGGGGRGWRGVVCLMDFKCLNTFQDTNLVLLFFPLL